MNKVILYIFNFLFIALAGGTAFHQMNIIYSYQGDVQINNPEISQAFYDELHGKLRSYFVDSEKSFDLYLNLLVPAVNVDRTYSYFAKVSSLGNIDLYQPVLVGGNVLDWEEIYDPLVREYFFKGQVFSEQLPPGKYSIEVYSTGPVLSLTTGDAEQTIADNYGKYVLQIGQKKPESILAFLNACWQLPLLKLVFFKTSVLQFFLTPFAIIGVGMLGALLILLALLYYLAGVARNAIKHQQAKTLLLASSFPQMKDEIIKLLQKPAYDVTVAFITTASKPEENLDYLKRDWLIMKEELGFNIEEVDIEGKKERQVMKLLELKDIIFVEGGNTFYLLNAMRRCNFERVIKKLLKEGRVYLGVSAGSMVAGKTIKTSAWRSEFKGINRNTIGLKNLKGLNLVPFDIFVHFQPEHAEIIKKKIPWRWQRRKLKILTDEQAVLVQGKDIALIGEGEQIIV